MTGTALIPGSSGRFGHNMAQAFRAAGWQIQPFRRGMDDLMQAAQGADVIVHGWNPAYPDWAQQVPGQVAQVIAAACTCRAWPRCRSISHVRSGAWQGI